MDDHLQQAAVQAIGNVFETMFFVFLEPLDPALQDQKADRDAGDREWLRCVIGFQGRIQGHLRLGVPYGLALELATNFLGLESAASETQVVDMVKELSNMICGNLFSIFDKQQVYTLDMPQAALVPLDPGPEEVESPEMLRLDFMADEWRIHLEIEWGPPAGAAG